MTGRYRRAIDVDWVVAGDEAVLFDSRSGELFELDRWATSIWSRLDGTATIDQITESIASATGEAPKRIRDDIENFCASLADLHLLDPSTPEIRA